MHICSGEEWVPVIVDDYLPCLAKTGYAPFDIEIFQKVLPSGSLLYGPIFTHSAQNDLWVCLLEKGAFKSQYPSTSANSMIRICKVKQVVSSPHCWHA